MGRRKSDALMIGAFIVGLALNLFLCVANLYYMARFRNVVNQMHQFMAAMEQF